MTRRDVLVLVRVQDVLHDRRMSADERAVESLHGLDTAVLVDAGTAVVVEVGNNDVGPSLTLSDIDSDEERIKAVASACIYRLCRVLLLPLADADPPQTSSSTGVG